jgi:hypothetical protein
MFGPVLMGGLMVSSYGKRSQTCASPGHRPSLTGFGVLNVLADPVLELHGPSTFATITNDNWRNTQEAEILSSGLAPANDLEAAIMATLSPRLYTSLLSGVNNGTGIGLVEIYDSGTAP